MNSKQANFNQVTLSTMAAPQLRRSMGRKRYLRFQMVMLLRVLILVGYPLIAIMVTFTGLSSATSLLTYPYRALVLALSLYIILRGQRSRLDNLVMIFFTVYTIRLLYDWNISEITGAEQALLFFVMTVMMPVIASMRGGPYIFDDKLFAQWVLIPAMATLVLALSAQILGLGYNPWADQGVQSTRLQFNALNPISLGHVAGTTLICSFYLLFEKRQSLMLRIASWSGIALGGLLILLTNSRGPVMATAVALIWFFMLRTRRLVYAAPFLLILPFFLSTDTELVSRLLSRFDWDIYDNASNAGRIMAQRIAMEAFFENPIFGAYYIDPTVGEGNYPHNLIIETAMALGMVGLIMFAAMLLRAWWKVTTFYNVEHPLLVMLLAQQFIATQLSGALWAAGGFFMILTLCLTARRTKHPRFVPGNISPTTRAATSWSSL